MLKLIQTVTAIVIGSLILIVLYHGVIQGGFNSGWGL